MAFDGLSRSMGELRVGEAATVLRVRCARPTAVRLMEMGLVPGTPFEVRRVAPLGDPMELFVNGYALSLRREEALAIDIEPPHSSR
jgi:ferrous iron transport protein A